MDSARRTAPSRARSASASRPVNCSCRSRSASCAACHPNDAGYDRLAGAVFRSLFYRPDLPLLAGEVINPPLNAPAVVAEWKPPASFYLAMAPAIALAVVAAGAVGGAAVLGA